MQQIGKAHINDAWPYLGPALARALNKAYGERELDDLRQACLNGEAQLFFHGKSALVTELIEYPRQKVCRLLACGGEMADVIQAWPEVKAWAKREGCKALEVCGRRGWQRVLGMGEAYTVSRAEL